MPPATGNQPGRRATRGSAARARLQGLLLTEEGRSGHKARRGFASGGGFACVPDAFRRRVRTFNVQLLDAKHHRHPGRERKSKKQHVQTPST
jgi:hypothetical protein